MKILSALMGMTIGGMGSAVLSYFAWLPWEYKLDPQGHNHAIGFVLPFVLLFGVICGLLLGLRLDTLRQRNEQKYWLIPPVGLMVGIIANYWTYFASLWPFHYAVGATVRPMFEGMFLAIIVLLAFLVGVPLGLWDIWRGVRGYWQGETARGRTAKVRIALAVVGLLLNLTPWPLGLALSDQFVAQRHISIEQ